MSNNRQSVDSTASAAPDSVSRSTPRLWFITEIQHMMHGFGDCPKPLSETAALVEEIVYRQMVDILYMAEDVRRQRNSRFINIEEFLYLLRRDKVKLKRLLHYLNLKDIKTAATKDAGLEDEDQLENDARQLPKKRRKICQDFLSVIDNTGELLVLLDDSMDDEIKLQRKVRAEIMTRNMTTEQYLEFSKARQASFAMRYKMPKFKEWLLSNITLEIKLSPFAVEILSYMAFETVAQIVDLALIVKRDMKATIDDPLSHVIAPECPGLSTLVPSISTQQTHVNGSPPSTPGSGADTSGQGYHFLNSASSSALRLKAKRNNQATWQLSENLLTGNAITTTEVREALRRYTQSIGPFADFSESGVDYPCKDVDLVNGVVNIVMNVLKEEL